MSKTKTPFFSMGSHGTVGGSLTSQKRGGVTLLREKPVPAYRRTLLQSYQRWLYQDYAFLYRDASEATRREYAVKAYPYHLTGFQMWMKEHLKDLANILAWHRLDADPAGVSRDSSSYHWNGTVVGASPSSLAIDGAASFDGLNDIVTIPHATHLTTTDMFCCEFFFQAPLAAVHRGLWNKMPQADWNTKGYRLKFEPLGRFEFLLNNKTCFSLLRYDDDILHHCVCQWEKPGPASIFIDGVEIVYNFRQNLNTDIIPSTGPLELGRNWTNQWYKGYLDNFVLHDRIMSQEEITRHSERRYPS